MPSKRIAETTCPDCSSIFNINENRAYKIRNRNFIWFYDAVNQFENHRKVQCPNCHKDFEAPEARLFGLFKSPYVAIVAGWVFIIASIGIIFGAIFLLRRLELF